jgi:hypothetical protein
MGKKKDFDWPELELLNINDHDWLRYNYLKRGIPGESCREIVRII